MSKLDPKPDNSGNLYSWSDLNSYLKMRFSSPGNPKAAIDPRNYAMTKEDIIEEAKKQGYKVTEKSDNHLEFE